MWFQVRYLPADARQVNEDAVQANDESQVLQQWDAQRGVLLSVQAKAQAKPRASVRPLAGGGFDVAWWCRELDTLVSAGMTVVEAIDTLAQDRSDAARRNVHESLWRSLQQGASLSKAMQDCGRFPMVLVAGVAASERASTLPAALRDYLQYDQLLRRLRRQAVSAAVYPALVTSIGAGVALFLLFYVIPRFSRMYGDLRGQLSTGTEFVLWLSRGLNDHAWAVAGALLAVLSITLWAWHRGLLIHWALALPDSIGPLQRQTDHFRLAKLYQALAVLFKGGYTVDQALATAGQLHLGTRFDRCLSQARRHIANGRSASDGLALAGLTDLTDQRLLAAGERTGGFEAVLRSIAERHSLAFEVFVERATRIVEPVLLLLVASIVGGLVVMMYMPIFDMAGGLGVTR